MLQIIVNAPREITASISGYSFELSVLGVNLVRKVLIICLDVLGGEALQTVILHWAEAGVCVQLY